MDARELIMTTLYEHYRRCPIDAECDCFSFEKLSLLRACIVREQQGDTSAWNDFVQLLENCRRALYQLRSRLEDAGWLERDFESGKFSFRELPDGTTPFCLNDETKLLELLFKYYSWEDVPDERPQRPEASRSEIMYIERKRGLSGPARIGRVTFSKTGRTIYYGGARFQSLKGYGFKANFKNMDTGTWYWISRCKADGKDTLYPAVVEIDDDVREDYWLTIRKLPAMVSKTSFRSEGKHAKRSPR